MCVKYGYCRISTTYQNEDRQIIALTEAGVPPRNIITAQKSGKDLDRPGDQRLCKKVREGDEIYIKSIDRLGRNYNEILEQWRYLSKVKKVGLVVLDMPLLDTRRGKDLTGELISDIVLQLLSYVAQTEREFIRQRQKEGIAAAKARGVHFGRQAMIIPDEFEEIFSQYEDGMLSSREAGRMLNVSHQTFLKWTKRSCQQM